MASPTEILSPPTMYVYFLYANFALLCIAITVGVIILLRRQATREQMTGVAEIDYPKIASQLQREILRLQEFRDRIYPEGAADAAIAEAKRPPGLSADQGASIASMNDEDLKALPEVQSILRAEIEKITQQHLLAIAQMDAARAGEPGDSEVTAKEITALKKEIETMRANAAAQSATDRADKKLESVVKDLKDRLNEYEIFEEDLSRVKELTKENEDLRQRLAGQTSDAPAEAPNSETQTSTSNVDIPEALEVEAIDLKPLDELPTDEQHSSGAQLMTGSTGSATQEFDEGAIEAAIESGESKFSVAPEETDETSADSVTAEFEKLLAGGPAVGSVHTTTEVPKGFEAEVVAPEPNISTAKGEEPALGGEDLMAEFEKLLGSVEKT